MKRIFTILGVLLLLFLSIHVSGAQNSASKKEDVQKFKLGVSSNLLSWADFGTVNLEVGVGVSQHFSLQAGAKYNPWKFTAKELQLPMYNNQTSAFVGGRWWPWYVFSGWWVGVKAQYSDYKRTGIWRPALEEGAKIGGGLSFGYTLMVHKNFNVEFGLGAWGGMHTKYNLYCCTECLNLRESGKKGFVGIDDVSVSLMYVF